MKRAISVNDLYTRKRVLHRLPQGLHELIGLFELTGSWIIWGDSGNGKTSLACMLAYALASIEKLFYNSMEEGDSETMKRAFKRVKMEERRRRVLLLNKESIPELKERLKKQRAPRIVIIDSVQYADITWTDYKALLAEFPGVLFIWISHEDGKLPAGPIAKKIRFDAHVKIRVVGFRAYAISRYGGGTPFTISTEKADEYYAGGLLDEKKMI